MWRLCLAQCGISHHKRSPRFSLAIASVSFRRLGLWCLQFHPEHHFHIQTFLFYICDFDMLSVEAYEVADWPVSQVMLLLGIGQQLREKLQHHIQTACSHNWHWCTPHLRYQSLILEPAILLSLCLTYIEATKAHQSATQLSCLPAASIHVLEPDKIMTSKGREFHLLETHHRPCSNWSWAADLHSLHSCIFLTGFQKSACRFRPYYYPDYRTAMQTKLLLARRYWDACTYAEVLC